jgi:hypothetical protein
MSKDYIEEALKQNAENDAAEVVVDTAAAIAQRFVRAAQGAGFNPPTTAMAFAIGIAYIINTQLDNDPEFRKIIDKIINIETEDVVTEHRVQ